jgi:hypothetical protein
MAGLGGSQWTAREIERYRPIIAVAEKELPLTEAHMEITQGYLQFLFQVERLKISGKLTHGKISQ